MSRLGEKLRMSRRLGASTWASMLAFGALRLLGRRMPWTRWLETNEFLDTLLDHGGALSRSGPNVAVEQRLDRLGGRLGADLRPGTSDLATWVQIAGLEEYAVVQDFLGAYSDHSVRTVLDAGANIGLATLYLAQAFPGSRIVAVEPDPGNFALLTRNVSRLGDRVQCVQAAFWPVDEPLEMDPEPFRGGREWSRAVRRATSRVPDGGTRQVPVLTPAGADALLGGQGVDLLKMDIEGAEAAFFGDPARCRDLLSRVGAIAIEIHPERVDPAAVLVALDDAGFLVVPGREILVGVRRTLLRRARLSPGA